MARTRLWTWAAGSLIACSVAAGTWSLLVAEPAPPPAAAKPSAQASLDRDPMPGQDPKTGRDAKPAGRWARLRPRPARSPEEAAQIEQLRAIGYVTGSIQDERFGVAKHLADEATPGLNLYASGHGPEAILMDMQGKVLHRWSKPFEEIFPDQPPLEFGKQRNRWWRRVHLLDDGSLLAIFDGLAIVKLDRDSNVVWARLNQAHHDLAILPNGDILVLTRTPTMIQGPKGEVSVLEDFVACLDADGDEKWRVSILDALIESHPEFLRQGKREHGDISHTNTVHVLEQGDPRLPGFAPGNVLVSMNALGLIAVLDPRTREFSWVRKTPPQGQHDPKLLANGNLLFFDNREDAKASAVLEIDPATDEVRWQYVGSPERPFYSRYCGAAERLASGNTLITESDAGRAFEVNAQGDIVWEFFNPHRAGEHDEFIAAIPELERLPIDAGRNWLSRPALPAKP